MIGHKPKEVLLQILKGARADQQYLVAVKLYTCDVCAQIEPGVRKHTAGPPSKYAFNHELHIDVLETYDDSGTLYSWLSAVCCGTTLHMECWYESVEVHHSAVSVMTSLSVTG